MGASATDLEKKSWRGLVSSSLCRAFSEHTFYFVNAAIGGTASIYGAYRFGRDVWKHGKVDLLFVEFAVNDQPDYESSVRGMEGIVRQAAGLNPDIHICFLYSPTDTFMEQYAIGEIPATIANHQQVAAHYSVPDFDVAQAFASLLNSSNELNTWNHYFVDRVHPNDRGHQLYADFIWSFLKDAVTLCLSGCSPKIDLSLPPINECNLEKGKLIVPSEIIVQNEAWEYVRNWRLGDASNWLHPADVIVGKQIGDRFEAQFKGKAIGIAVLIGVDGGEIDYSIDNEAERTTSLFDEHCLKFNRVKMVMLGENLGNGEHTISVKVSAYQHELSIGHTFAIQCFLLDG